MSGTVMRPPAAVLERFGCSAAFWCELRDLGRAMVRAGLSEDATPLRAFGHQRHKAIHGRGIGWELTLPQWWEIWTVSGRWPERGLGRGYMMCRKGDIGPYAVGNVFIGPGAENLSAAAKKSDLPIGVARKTNGKPYRAYCNIGRKQKHLGSFETVWEARAAYLRALDLDLTLTAAASAPAELREAA